MITTQRKKSILLPTIAFVLTTAVGNMVGKLLGLLITGGIFNEIIAEGFSIGLETQKLSVGTWYMEFGFNVSLNLMGLLFMILFIYIYKKA